MVRTSYAAAIVINAMLVVLAQQLGAGAVPIPPAWQWVVPVAVAGITALTALLPRLGEGRRRGRSID
jgi:hypothetical protein